MSDNAPAPAQSLPSVLFATAQLPIIRERSRATAVNEVGSGMNPVRPSQDAYEYPYDQSRDYFIVYRVLSDSNALKFFHGKRISDDKLTYYCEPKC